MKNLRLLLLFLLATTASADLRDEIEAVERKWVEAYNRHDADALAELYLPEAQSFLPEVGVLKGQDAIRKYLKEMAKEEGELTQSVKTLDVFAGEDMATETGMWAVKREDGSMTEDGTYWMVWKKKDGEWKVLREIWNSTQRKFKLSESLKPVERLLGTWVAEANADGQKVRASLTSKAVAGGSAIFTEGRAWVDGKLVDEWCNLMSYRADSKSIVDSSASRKSGHSVSIVLASDDKIVFQETGANEDGSPHVLISELTFESEDRIRLNQPFGFRGGKPMPELMKDLVLKRVD